MLRIFVLLLLLANAGFFAWQQGMLAPVLGDIAGTQREPERLAQQVNPDQLVVQGELPAATAIATTTQQVAEQPVDAAMLTPESTVADAASVPLQPASTAASVATEALASAAAAPAAGATQCLEAGPYSKEEEGQIQTTLARVLPASTWRVDRFPVPGLWLIYMGPYPDDASLKVKQGELQRIGGVSFEEVRSPANLRMGFSLGRFNSQQAADIALNAMQTKGVRTARVVSVRPPMDVSVIRVQQADAKMQQQLKGLPLPPDREFVGCLVP
jgi:hypothetical protein